MTICGSRYSVVISMGISQRRRPAPPASLILLCALCYTRARPRRGRGRQQKTHPPRPSKGMGFCMYWVMRRYSRTRDTACQGARREERDTMPPAPLSTNTPMNLDEIRYVEIVAQRFSRCHCALSAETLPMP
jgi:hypothetical protein